jgi:Cu(I)/Ag(I) efflux system membrane fusion protein
VLDGLASGERVATAGSFLIDAENRLEPGSAAERDEPPAPKDAAARSAATPHRH